MAVEGFGPRYSMKPPMDFKQGLPLWIGGYEWQQEAREADAVVRRKTGGLGLGVEVERSGQIEGVPWKQSRCPCHGRRRGACGKEEQAAQAGFGLRPGIRSG